MGNESTTRLVGETPNATNQPTAEDDFVYYCRTTGLHYLRGNPTCTEEVVVGRFTESEDGGPHVVRFDHHDHPETLRTRAQAAEKELKATSDARDMAVLEATVYHDQARILEGERDRARDTAAALEEELHAAKLNLAHVRLTLALNDLFVALHLRHFPRLARQRLRQAIGSHCEVCTPHDDPFQVVEANHPDLTTERLLIGE